MASTAWERKGSHSTWTQRATMLKEHHVPKYDIRELNMRLSQNSLSLWRPATRSRSEGGTSRRNTCRPMVYWLSSSWTETVQRSGKSLRLRPRPPLQADPDACGQRPSLHVESAFLPDWESRPEKRHPRRRGSPLRSFEPLFHSMRRVTTSAMQAGRCSPSISIVWARMTWVPLSPRMTSLTSTLPRSRDPTTTGWRKRTLLSP